MSLQTWNEVLVSAQAAGTLFNTYTTAKTVLPSGCLITLPPNWWYVGRMIRVKALGAISNIVTTPGTITLQVNIGSTAIFSSGAIQLNATAHTTLPFDFEAILTCRAVGASGNCIGQAKVSGIMFTNTAGQTDNANNHVTLMAPATAPAVGSNFDTTAQGVLDFFAGFSISNAGNGIQIQQYMVEALN